MCWCRFVSSQIFKFYVTVELAQRGIALEKIFIIIIITIINCSEMILKISTFNMNNQDFNESMT